MIWIHGTIFTRYSVSILSQAKFGKTLEPFFCNNTYIYHKKNNLYNNNT